MRIKMKFWVHLHPLLCVQSQTGSKLTNFETNQQFFKRRRQMSKVGISNLRNFSQRITGKTLGHMYDEDKIYKRKNLIVCPSHSLCAFANGYIMYMQTFAFCVSDMHVLVPCNVYTSIHTRTHTYNLTEFEMTLK